ncbi:DDE-type integrase/transposase/recombinase [Panacibacter ginsenosidivorans]|uniref:DDE-type integrase/transposase/recombinase n=1 Tax=Panacibacter ginsenosidivorans TaxID=1813871 RepID=A0A5B8VGH1_9BACT|nr:DDE-type integrase/transposase/recombinase [Panacibacter ginsenosidivorans]QEC70243.1 DDE-type integrase/transposase/recombinase [Panacibacter ginsenosidivorans]
MNRLPLHKKVQIITLLVEGNSLRSCSRIADVSINTVTKLLVDVGIACQKFHDEKVVGITSQKIQCDEIWSFVYSKEKNVPDGMEDQAGDVWTWTALDADTKLMVAWNVGSRDAETANEFMYDVASRLNNRVQLTTDGHKPYLQAVSDAFGTQIDFAQLIKLYGGSEGTTSTERKYSPAECTGCKKTIVTGEPDAKYISTSYVERSNLTMRMGMRRFTRLTNAFSKKIENHCHAIALHFVYYNFVRIHKTLRVPPAMAAKLIKRLMTIEDIARLIPDEAPKKRGNYKKKEG